MTETLPKSANLTINSFEGASHSALNREFLISIVESYVKYYASGEGHTARAKRYDLQHFLTFLGECSGKSIDQLLVSEWTFQRTRDFVDNRLSVGDSVATVARRLATLKHFGRTLGDRVPGFVNPAREVKAPKFSIERPAALSPEDLKHLIQAADSLCAEDPTSYIRHRDRFLLLLLLSTGLRADEVRLLTMLQIDPSHSWLLNVRTKGKKFRRVYLNQELRPTLEDYLVRRALSLRAKFPVVDKLSERERLRLPVFLSFYAATLDRPASLGLSSKSIWRIIAGFGRRAERTAERPLPRLHPHVLRHTFAHGLLESEKDIRLVAQALGHSDVRITMRYTERRDEEVAEAIERASSPMKFSHP